MATNPERNGTGSIITALRGSLTQKEFAEKIGVTSSAISHWEKGKRKPSPETLKKIISLQNIPSQTAELLLNSAGYDVGEFHRFSSDADFTVFVKAQLGSIARLQILIQAEINALQGVVNRRLVDELVPRDTNDAHK